MIVVAGEALVDILIDATTKVQAVLGGGPFNAARTIGRLGHPCRFIGRLSSDRFGAALASSLAADSIEIAVGDLAGEPTTLASAELDDHGAAAYRFYVEGTSAPRLSCEHLRRTSLDDADAVHVGSLALIIEPMASALLTWLRNAPVDVLVMIDLNCRPQAVTDHHRYRTNLYNFVACAHVVKASREDISFLYPHDTAESGAARLLASGARVVLLTDADRPTRIITSRGSRTVSVPLVTVVDTVGAGDSFGAAFLTWWVENGGGLDGLEELDDLERAVAVGNEVSTITCTRSGANPPRRSELAAWS